MVQDAPTVRTTIVLSSRFSGDGNCSRLRTIDSPNPRAGQTPEFEGQGDLLFDGML